MARPKKPTTADIVDPDALPPPDASPHVDPTTPAGRPSDADFLEGARAWVDSMDDEALGLFVDAAHVSEREDTRQLAKVLATGDEGSRRSTLALHMALRWASEYEAEPFSIADRVAFWTADTALFVERVRRAKADGVLPPPAVEARVEYFEVTRGGRFCGPMGVTSLPTGSVVSSQTHDLDEVRRQGIELRPCEEPRAIGPDAFGYVRPAGVRPGQVITTDAQMQMVEPIERDVHGRIVNDILGAGGTS